MGLPGVLARGGQEGPVSGGAKRAGPGACCGVDLRPTGCAGGEVSRHCACCVPGCCCCTSGATAVDGLWSGPCWWGCSCCLLGRAEEQQDFVGVAVLAVEIGDRLAVTRDLQPVPVSSSTTMVLKLLVRMQTAGASNRQQAQT